MNSYSLFTIETELNPHLSHSIPHHQGLRDNRHQASNRTPYVSNNINTDVLISEPSSLDLEKTSESNSLEKYNISPILPTYKNKRKISTETPKFQSFTDRFTGFTAATTATHSEEHRLNQNMQPDQLLSHQRKATITAFNQNSRNNQNKDYGKEGTSERRNFNHQISIEYSIQQKDTLPSKTEIHSRFGEGDIEQNFWMSQSTIHDRDLIQRMETAQQVWQGHSSSNISDLRGKDICDAKSTRFRVPVFQVQSKFLN